MGLASGPFACQVRALSSRGIVPMNRREALLLLAGTAALPDQLLAVGRAVHKKVRAETLRALTPQQNETVATIAELIIPKTDTPGAREAGVPAFIDVMVADWGDDDQRKMFAAGRPDGGGRGPPAVREGFFFAPPPPPADNPRKLGHQLARPPGRHTRP